mmetsp:Transcript_21703/g.42372  ORF Transcript_21703/g.42372 Transcript_21703/m.42372 type:complete len:113 (-) Transcript_21703:1486-1824(-)
MGCWTRKVARKHRGDAKHTGFVDGLLLLAVCIHCAFHRFCHPRFRPKSSEHEVACGGRRRLLPCFASALSLHGEKITPHSSLRIVDFSVMDLIVPGKGRSAHEADVLPEYFS